MSAGSPPDKPVWFARLLELGNHNKLIAAATLVTLATGLPYLVTVTIGVFSGETEEATLEELLARAVAQMQEQAIVSIASAKGGSATTREAAGSALASLASQATASGATSTERNAVRDALREFGSGNAAPALARLSTVALAQEARGDLDAAAQTWCDRGYLQIFTQHAAALSDFERANDLSATGIDPSSQRERARLLGYVFRFDESVHALRRAIRGARETGDLRMELLASAQLAWAQATSWEGSPEFEQEKLDASLRVLEGAGPLMDESFADMELLNAYGKAASRAGAVNFMVEAMEIGPTPHAEAVRALLEERLARLGDARSTGASALDCAAADCVLRGMLALVGFALGDMDGVVELALAALDSAGQVLEAPEFDLDRALAIQPGLNMATLVLQKSGAPAGWRRGEELVLVLVRSMMAREQVTTPLSIFQLGARTIHVGRAQVREGDVEGGIATMREGLEVLLRLEAIGVASEMASLWRAEFLYKCALEVLSLDRELARAWTVEADRMIESDVLGTPAEGRIPEVSPEIRALYVEFELGPPPYDRVQR